MSFHTADNDRLTLLSERLLKLEESFNYQPRIDADPVRFVRRYADPLDREIAGLVASSFAYGAVAQIGKTLEKVFSVLGDSPRDFVLNRLDRANPPFDGFYHRFNNREDLLSLLWAIGRVIETRGSLEALFLEKYTPGDIAPAMNHFSREFVEISKKSPFTGMRSYGYFFPAPEKGSACKRMCLYLRWMNRTGPVDPGGWTGVSRADLIVPVDTHIQRLGTYLGFTRRKNSSWKMAVEITGGLKKIDPEDPLRLDFLLCHLGMSGLCPRKPDREKCRACLLEGLCLGRAEFKG